MSAGLFITLEGGEGSGKSTQAKHLKLRLEQAGHAVVQTREPGGSEGAEDIRALLVTGEPDRWDGMTEALLLFAARHDHLERIIKPALKAGKIVLCDRFTDSTMAYQGYGHNLGRETIEKLNAVALDGFGPDLTLILDLPVDTGLSRAMSRGDGEQRYEDMDIAFHQRLRDGFLDIAKREPDRCKVVDASGSEEDVAEKISGVVMPLLATGKACG
ncbi:MAG: dTMP kinase [Rhodospirillaceae bacterium]